MTPVLLDCDPGHDDAVALIYAARHLDLRAITTVFGNQSLEHVTRADCATPHQEALVVARQEHALMVEALEAGDRNLLCDLALRHMGRARQIYAERYLLR